MKKINNSTINAILLMALTAFLWSIGGLFIKIINWNPFNIAFARSFIAIFVILILFKNIKFKLSFPLIAAGIANALTMILFVTATKTTTATNAVVLQYIAPIITAFLSYPMLKEKIGFEHLFSLILMTIGIIFMFFDKLSPGFYIGNILAIGSAFTASFYIIFMRMQKKSSTIESVLLSHILAAFICLIASLFLPFPKITSYSLIAALILGIFQIGFSSILFSIAIKKLSAISANLIAVIEAIFNPIWVFIALGEKPQINSIIGGIIILIAITSISILSAKKKLT